MLTTKSRHRRSGMTRGSWVIVFLLFVAGLIWFAPPLIGSSFKHKLGEWALPHYEGEIEIGTIQLGWMSPILLRDVTARDPRGEPIATVEKIQGNRSLFSLLINQKDLGHFDVMRPELHIRVNDESSNWEKVVSSLNQEEKKKKQDLIDVVASIEIKKGSILITDAVTDREWTIAPLTLKLKIDPEDDLDFELNSSVTISNDVQESGEISAKTENNYVVLNFNSIPIDLVEPFLHRQVSDARLGGIVSGQLSCRLPDADEMMNISVSGNINVENFKFASTENLGYDVFRLATFKAGAQLRVTSNQLIADSIKVTTDVGDVAAQVTINLSEESADLANLLGAEDCAVNATVNLAQLAELLPATLGIRENTQIDSGDIKLNFTSRQAETGREWIGRLYSTPFLGVANGRPISWQQPIHATFKMHESDAGTVIDEFICQSEFLRVDGKGTLNEAWFAARCDLNRLVDQLGQFVDLENSQLSGVATGNLEWKRQADDRLAVTGKVWVQDFQLYDADADRSWTEPHLQIAFSAQGVASDKQVDRIDDMVFRLESDTDQLFVQLTHPVDTCSEEAVWPLAINIEGDLATWASRFSPLATVMDWDVRGTVNGTFLVVVGPTRTDVSEGKIELTSLEVHRDVLHVVEPMMRWEITGSWDAEENIFHSDSITMTSTSAAFRAKDLMVRMDSGDTPALNGSLAVRGDLSKLMAWFEDPKEDSAQQFAGQLTGDIELIYADNVTCAEWKTKITNFIIQRNTTVDSPSGPGRTVSQGKIWKQLWSEDEMWLNGRGALDHENNNFQLDEVILQSELLVLSASATVANVNDVGEVAVKGQADYDIEDMVQVMQGFVGEGFQLVGHQQQPFTVQSRFGNKSSLDVGVRESLVFERLVATGGVGWESGNIYGLVLGPANVQATLTDQRVRFEPIDLTVNDGHLRVQPEILLTQNLPLLIVPQGRILDHVSITREMCADWLKYVAPLLADATRVDGQLSVDVDHAKVSLGDMDLSDVRGSATIHSGAIRPGPLLNQIVPLVTHVRSIFRRKPLAGLNSDDPKLTVTEQQIQFHLIDGRVYHANLKMRLGDIDVYSSGSVGLDETLDMKADLHIPKSWASEDRLLSTWGGKVIQIPIGGTLDNPDIDDSIFANIAIEAVPDVIERVIDSDIIQRGIDRLLDRN